MHSWYAFFLNYYAMSKKRAHASGQYYSGTSGLKLDIPKYLFPEQHQQSSRLEYYSTLFNSIEVNSSFYKLPLPKTVSKWADSVEKDFRFSFKLWKEITHVKGLHLLQKDVELFMQSIESAGKKKGCLLIQFPPSVSMKNYSALKKLLTIVNNINTKSSWRIAVEFRNKTWYDEKVYELLQSYKATLVIHDIPKSATPFFTRDYDFIYMRFHGPTGNYRGDYSDEFLAEYAGYVREWLREGKTVYAYFNNTMGNAFNNLKTLNSFVRK